jgi:prevent-host-death family protein
MAIFAASGKDCGCRVLSRVMTSQTDLPAVPAAEFRQRWKPVLSRTTNDHVCQVISRNRRPLAVLVPAFLHAMALRTAPVEAASVRGLSSSDARGSVSQVLTDVKEHGVHHVIAGDDYHLVALVPYAWFEAHVRPLERLLPPPPSDPS